jgi:hypothetical protein
MRASAYILAALFGLSTIASGTEPPISALAFDPTETELRFLPIGTNENVADSFTKPMSGEKLERYTAAMGLSSVSTN